MEPREELARLRRELDAWRTRGEALARRVAALEDATNAAMQPADAPPSPPAGPPPLPAAAIPAESAPAPVAAMEPEPLQAVAATAAQTETPPTPERPAPVLPRRPPSLYDEGPSLFERLGAQLRRIGPAEEMSWEMALGSYWLPRAAMVLLAVGVMWLLGLGINRFAGAWWMPHLRLSLGYALCAGLLAWGWRQRERTPGFARVLLGGGIGLSYFVTFATHFIPFSRVFSRPEPTLLLLAGVTVAWMIVAQARNARWMALGVVAMGHGTIGLSTLSLVVPSPFAILGVFGLAAAGGWFYARRGWFVVAAVSLAGSYANHLFWMSQSPGSDRVLDYSLGLAVLAGYGALFALADWRAPAAIRDAIAPRWRTVYASFNAGAVLFLGTLLTQAFDFSAPRLHLFYFSLAAALFGLGLLYRRGGSTDTLFHAYATKASVVFTLGLATWLEGASLTLSLALEAVALLEAARRSGSVAPRVLALGALALAIGHGLGTGFDAPRIALGEPGFAGRAVSAIGIAVALLAFAVRWQFARDRGETPAPAAALRWHNRPPWHAFLSWSEQAAAPRPMQGLLVPDFAAFGAAALLLLHLAKLAGDHFGPAAMLAALAMVFAAVHFGARPLAHASWPLAAVGWFVWHFDALPAYVLEYAAPGHRIRLLQALAIWAPLLAMSECARRAAPASWSRLPAVVSALPFVYAALAAEAFTSMGAVLLHPNHAPLVLGLASIAALLHAARAGAPAFTVFAGVLAVVAARMLHWADWNGIPAAWGIAATLALAAAVPIADPRVAGPRLGLCLVQHPWGRYVLPGAAVWAVCSAAWAYAPAGWTSLPLILIGALAALAMRRLSPDPLGWAATALAVAGVLFWISGSPRDSAFAWHSQAALLVVGLPALDRWFTRLDTFPRRAPGALAVAGSWLAAVVYVVRHWSDENAMYLLVLIGGAYLAYGAWCGGVTPVLLAAAAATMGTLITVAMSHDESLPTRDLLLNYGAAIAFWFVWERGFARFTEGGGPRQDLNRALQAVFTAIPCVLLVALVERLPFVGGAYLSIGWTLAALAMLGAGATTGHAHYRYAGLLTFAIVLYRIVLIDSRGLDAVYRIAGMIFLGLVLLGVGYAYVRSREQAQRGGPDGPEDTTAKDAGDAEGGKRDG